MKLEQPANATDAQLLTRFEESRDQRAFAELVRRYGSMVLFTARRVLRNPEDVQEAFQATMFALAKASGQLRRKAAVAGWMHKTAYRCAAGIHRANVRWKRSTDTVKERLQSDPPGSETTDPLLGIANEEIEKILDEELANLPEPLRDSIVLCELQGISQKDAAKRLGLPTSTVNNRLVRGRRLLHARLVRRGATLTLAGISLKASGQLMAAMNENLISDITTKATLYVAGKSAVDVGVSSIVIQTANKVVSTMTRAKLIAIVLVAVAIVPLISSFSGMVGFRGDSTFGAEIFHDRFDDGDYADGMPVTWGPAAGFGESTLISVVETVEDGFSLAIEASGFGASAGPSGLAPMDNTSMRSQVRLISGSAIGLAVRNNLGAEFDSYFISLNASGTALLGVGKDVGGWDTLDSVSTDLRVFDEDVILQLDVIDDSLQAWAWRQGSARPSEPLLVATDNRIASGQLGIFALGPWARGLFRDVQVATASIPEPSTSVLSVICVMCLVVWRNGHLRI